ncbi:hypothetical protein [Methylobacterium trifolii]|uniref:Uncharacterized protein n=1 Tax=Methylobacterium trifolii TaxID=1003092 RepID=A0ABQ4U568_9HYPH|nr:hypothetical protein [Methylobacterium trifolii]GJE60950.1 hypothetical protein MPOCJGCO_3069 [Methylobacterium trifolii]
MGTARVAHRHPPVLDGGEARGDIVTYQRDIPRTNRDGMEAEMAAWAGRYVSRGRRAQLMADARASVDDVISYILHAPLPMALPADGGGPRYQVYLHLYFGMTSGGAWWVRAISFGMSESAAHKAGAQQSMTRDRLLEAAERRQAQARPARWKLYFDASDGSGDFALDAKLGQTQVQSLIDSAHELAKSLEPTMKNPIGWDGETDLSLASEATKAVLGPVAGMAKDRLETVATVVDLGGKAFENAQARDGFKLAADGMDVALMAATKNPVTGLASVILGSFLSIAIANDTARVARARANLFSFYIGGFLQKLTDEPFDRPRESARKAMHARGLADAAGLSPASAYQVQLALLHYVATHNVENQWSLQDIDKGWIFPTHYQLNWSPALLARAFVWQINTLRYLTR